MACSWLVVRTSICVWPHVQWYCIVFCRVAISFLYITLAIPVRRWCPPSSPCPSPRHVRLARPRLARLSPRSAPSDARATADIKKMPIDAREAVISKKCHHRAPRITDDSNSQNVNVGFFQLKALVSQSVTDHRDYYGNYCVYDIILLLLNIPQRRTDILSSSW